MARILTLLLLCLGVSGAPKATDSSDTTIAQRSQELLARMLPREDAAGAVLLVARGSDVIYRGARGRANVELAVPLTPDHVFRIASVTKIFTAAMVLRLADRRQLALDDRLGRYLPGFPSADEITIRQLLNHTAGISDVVRDPQPGFSRRDVSSEVRLAEIRKRPLDFVPGTKWAYSNAGYILLGAIVERITREPWHAALEKQLLRPLGLKQTRFGTDSTLIPGRVTGYTRDRPGAPVRNAGFISMTIPDSAGALVSTADELRIWIRQLMRGQVIDRETLQEMISPSPTAAAASPNYQYGYGVYVWKVRGTTMIGHTGQINGFTAAVGYLPDRDITTVVLANDDTFDARVAGRRLTAIAIGEPYPDVVPAPPSLQALRDLEGTFQFDGVTPVTLMVRDGTLYWERGSRRALPMQMTSLGGVHFVPDELTYIRPVRDAGGRIVALEYFPDGEGPPRRLARIAR